jgi:hypothetical protein
MPPTSAAATATPPRASPSTPAANVYITGDTWSASDFPLVNPIQPNHKFGGTDAFVAKLNPEGNAIVYSTFLGGNGTDAGRGIAVDAMGQAAVAG